MDNTLIPCRACTRENLKLEMHFLYQDAILSDIFTQLSTLQIYEFDGLPTHICTDCYNQLKVFIKFRRICVSSDETFRRGLLEKTKIECPQVEVILSTGEDIKVKIEQNDDSEKDFQLNDHKIDNKSDIIDNFNAVEELNAKCSPRKRIKKTESSKKMITNKDSYERKTYICDKCGKTFRKKHRIEAHLRQHLGLNPFLCHICNVSFRKFSSISLHKKTKHGDLKFAKHKCTVDECDKAYGSKSALRVHVKEVHKSKESATNNIPLICDQCGKIFKTKYLLKEHSYAHTGESPFPCTQCPSTFTKKYELKVHLMRHNNIRNYICALCGARRTTKKELRTHMSIHEDTAYPCELCSAVFNSKRNVTRHNRIVHRRHKPYVCKFCQHAFSTSHSLKYHTMIHTGEKPHACTICDKRFIQPPALKAHMKVHNKS